MIAKEIKNIMYHSHRTEDTKYFSMDVGATFEPPLVDLYMRACAAGNTTDTMKQFLARALMYCMAALNKYNHRDVLNTVENLAREVDLDFTCEPSPNLLKQGQLEIVSDASEFEAGTNIGVQK